MISRRLLCAAAALAPCLVPLGAHAQPTDPKFAAWLAGVRAEVIHVVGGGCQNRLLNQLTADACARPVIAGPVEATAAGNILTQALGLRLIGSLDDARAVVRRSFELTSHEPAKSSLADARYAFFKTLVGR